MVQLANTHSFYFFVNYVEINDNKNEFGNFTLLPSGWLKKYHKLSIISPSHSKNQEQWINEMWTGTGNEVGMRNAKGQRKRCDGLEREEEQHGLEVQKTCVCLKKF